MASHTRGCYWDNKGNCTGRCVGFDNKECVLDDKYNCVCQCGLDENAKCTGWCPGADQTCQFYLDRCHCARGAGGAEEEKKFSSRQIDPTIQLLVNRQRDRLPSVLRELRAMMKNGRMKRGHWIWWVFPQNQAGRAEPRSSDRFLYGEGKTKVTHETAAQLLAHAPPEWKAALNLICSLINRYGYTAIIPRQDWGRISFFCDFWLQVRELPDWLHDVILCILTSPGYVDGRS